MTDDYISTTTQTCCELIARHGPQSIVDICARTTFTEGNIRKSIATAVLLGYLSEGEKIKGTRKNRRKTYVRTDKPIPRAEPEEESISMLPEFEPRRDWAVTALFGPYEARA